MTRKVKGSNLPSININKQSLLLLNRLEGDEIKTILNSIQRYVYKGEDVEVDEELEDVLESILDNIENIGVKYLNKVATNRENGKKGGRPKKVKNDDITPNEDFDKPTTNNDTTSTTNNDTTSNTNMTTNLPNAKIDEIENIEDDFDNHSEELNKFLDENEREIGNCLQAIADYFKNKTIENMQLAQQAKEHIQFMLNTNGIVSKKDLEDFAKYTDISIEYRINKKEDDYEEYNRG